MYRNKQLTRTNDK